MKPYSGSKISKKEAGVIGRAFGRLVFSIDDLKRCCIKKHSQ
jgi:hypothetical protein